MSDSELDTARLREVAEAALARPWGLDEIGDIWSVDADGQAHLIARGRGEADAEHIAAFDPPTALALLDHIAALSAGRDAAVRAHANLVAGVEAVAAKWDEQGIAFFTGRRPSDDLRAVLADHTGTHDDGGEVGLTDAEIDQFGAVLASHLREEVADGTPPEEMVERLKTWVETLLTCHFCGAVGLPSTPCCEDATFAAPVPQDDGGEGRG